MTDIKLVFDGLDHDIALVDAGDDVVTDEGLETSVRLLLGIDARESSVTVAELLGTQRRGFFGALVEPHFGGSLLHRLERSPLSAQVEADFRDYVRDSLQPLITSGIASAVDVETSRSKKKLTFSIVIKKPDNTQSLLRYSALWTAQGVTIGI